DTASLDFNVRAISMADYTDITTLEEFVGFLYGMVAGNHDIETIFIDGILKQANITMDNLGYFINKLDKIAKENKIEFIISISIDKNQLPELDGCEYAFLN
ncbi:MAG: hypothetical protein SPD93_02290, partial [Lachnospiraceae bacterium]|nr:hypothetical protein [Lachnospiraceae bacterium]